MQFRLGFPAAAAAALWIGAAQAGSFATFEVPGSADTQPAAINIHGVVTCRYNARGVLAGFTLDGHSHITGFVWTP